MNVKDAFTYALEWRVISFILTVGYFWLVTGHLASATAHSFALHLILFGAQVLYNLYRT